MNLIYKKGFMILIFSCILACNNNCNVKGIIVTEQLLTLSQEKSVAYCELLDLALKGNNRAIKQLSLIDFKDSAGYDHGTILVKIIFKIGEDKYINALHSLNLKQKKYIISYLDVGLLYGNFPDLKKKKGHVIFPKVYSYLRN